MIEKRWQMVSLRGKIIQMPCTCMGWNFLVGLRKGRSDLFKRQRIKEVQQQDAELILVGILI